MIEDKIKQLKVENDILYESIELKIKQLRFENDKLEIENDMLYEAINAALILVRALREDNHIPLLQLNGVYDLLTNPLRLPEN